MKKNKLIVKKKFLLSSIVFFILFVLISYLSKVYKIYGGLDAKFGYSVKYAYSFIEHIGRKGIHNYYLILLVDFFYLLAYTSFLYYTYNLIILNYTKKNFKNKFLYNYIAYIAFLPGIFDIIENILIIVILYNFPKHLNTLVKILNIVTISKWIFVIFNILVIIILIGILLFMKMQLIKIKQE